MTKDNFSISGNIVDVIDRRIFPGVLYIENGRIIKVEENTESYSNYIFPGFIDSHIHIESSMLVPSEFARLAVVHGSVGAVCDPHEIANVLGVEGIEFMIANGRQVPFKFYFGAPSCVPATPFESSAVEIDSKGVEKLLERDDIFFLAEVMNFPGVINQDTEITQKIKAAHRFGKKVDGHAPGLTGSDLQKYAQAGISTDHECSSLKEAIEKISLGFKILIREGSAAKDFNALIPLIETHPASIMFCTDDLHPDDLVRGHINLLIKNALSRGYDLFDVIRAVSYNPRQHYNLDNGLLQKEDAADIVVVDNLRDFNILETYIDGVLVAQQGESPLNTGLSETPNRFSCSPVSAVQLKVPALGTEIRVIQAMEGEISTRSLSIEAKIENDLVVSDFERDILKLVLLNRYEQALPAIAFVKGFGLKEGAIASSVSHDNHNIITVGTNDSDVAVAIDILIENKGGIAVVNGSRQLLLPLPVAGIMTNTGGYHTADTYLKLDAAAKELGCTLEAPFMTLSFLALLVIPELKMSDQGLFDVGKFEHVSLFV
jgi:adenine deaminase